MNKILNIPLNQSELESIYIIYNFCVNTIKANTEKYDEIGLSKLSDLKLVVDLCGNYLEDYKNFLTVVIEIDNKEFSDVKKADFITTLASIMVNSDFKLTDLELDNLLLLVDFLTAYNSKEYEGQVNIYGSNQLLDNINSKTNDNNTKIHILEYFDCLLDETEDINDLDYTNPKEAMKFRSSLINLLKNCTLDELLEKIEVHNEMDYTDEIRRI